MSQQHPRNPRMPRDLVRSLGAVVIVRCDRCKGRGNLPELMHLTCPKCQGSGKTTKGGVLQDEEAQEYRTPVSRLLDERATERERKKRQWPGPERRGRRP